ncbi:hypothetical protein CRM22_003194 [Opisthorchis felineus]|uniref:Amino acid permease/ SLC12A domain-containing protein n=1 Tax=Opisthorchis felineus TaxID=147828 RepID=A0A4V6RH43_OPIFE|nr:hypothetical protein CRM22_003194 [Opisthorchis felineus]
MASDSRFMTILRVITSTKGDEESTKLEEVPEIKGGARLSKSIGLLSSITIVVGSVIGSGIFVSPQGILAMTNSFGASIIVWIACGLFSLVGAYCYAELGTMMPRSGADYSYVYEAFGPFFGFLRLWIEVIVAQPVAAAIISMVFANYLLKPAFPTCAESSPTAVRLLACVCVRRTEEFEDPFEGSNWNPGSLTVAFYNGLFAYSGWNCLNCMIEEMKNPRRDLPIAITVSCLIITVIYTMANVAYATVLTIPEILNSDAVAVSFAIRIYGPAWWIMPIFVAFSTFGGVNGTVMTTSRIFFVASQQNQMPKLLSFLQTSNLTPIPAIMLMCGVTIIYVAIGEISSLMNYLGFVKWLSIGISVLIVIIFRFTRRTMERPVKVPIVFPLIFVAVTLFLVIFTFVGAPTEALIGLAMVFSGAVVYVIGKVWRHTPQSLRKFTHDVTVGSQKLLRLVPGI